MRFELRRVRYMPKELRSGILYVSDEFAIAVHLCACGCGTKVRTPLGTTEWSVQETRTGPTLRPSVGNWQQACQSHYLITGGEVIWAEEWSTEKIAAGRHDEQSRREAHYAALDRQRGGWLRRCWSRIKDVFDL